MVYSHPGIVSTAPRELPVHQLQTWQIHLCLLPALLFSQITYTDHFFLPTVSLRYHLSGGQRDHRELSFLTSASEQAPRLGHSPHPEEHASQWNSSPFPSTCTWCMCLSPSAISFLLTHLFFCLVLAHNTCLNIVTVVRWINMCAHRRNIHVLFLFTRLSLAFNNLPILATMESFIKSCMCMWYVCLRVGMHVVLHVWKSEDNPKCLLFLFFYLVWDTVSYWLL